VAAVVAAFGSFLAPPGLGGDILRGLTAFLVVLGAGGLVGTWLTRLHDAHLFSLQVASYRARGALLGVPPLGTPPFAQLDRHFPAEAAAHHAAWAVVSPSEPGPTVRVPTVEERQVWARAMTGLAKIRTTRELPGSCPECRAWIWPYRAAAKVVAALPWQASA
jgi:hypothetical protein